MYFHGENLFSGGKNSLSRGFYFKGKLISERLIFRGKVLGVALFLQMGLYLGGFFSGVHILCWA